MRLRLSPTTIAQVLRNRQYTPGRDTLLTYPVELDPIDYPLGTTMVGASLVIMLDYGLNPLVVYQITTTLSADGQITDDGADGSGSLQFFVPAADLLGYRDLGPLACEVVVTDSRGYQGSLEKFALVPMVSTAGKPVDHVTVAPTDFALAYPNTQPLTVTAYDVDGNVLTGRTVVWSSSDPGTAPVDTNGVVSVEQAGTATITATVEGKSASADATTTVPPAIPWTHDQDFRIPAERARPLIYTPDAHTDGFTDTTPIPNSSGLFGNVRTTYLRDWNLWAEATLQGAIGDGTNPPQTHLATQASGGAGPVPGSTCFDVAFLPGFDANSYVSFPITITQPSNDNQDVTDFKRGGFLGVVTRPGNGDVGKKIYLALADVTNDPANPVIYGQPLLYTIGATQDWPGLDLDAYAHLTPFLSIIARPAFDQAPIATGFRLVANSLTLARLPETPGDRPRLNAYHATLGLASRYQHQNCWAENNISFSGGAGKVVSTTDAPDAANYWSGHKLDTYTLPAGGYVQMTAAAHVEQVNAVPSNAPPNGLWVHIYAPQLADQSLQASVIASGGPTLGPVAMTLDKYGFHRARIETSVGGDATSVIDNLDGTITLNLPNAHGLTNGQLVDVWLKAGNAWSKIPNVAATVLSGTSVKVTAALPVGTTTGNVFVRFLNWTAKIQNNGAAPLVFLGTRLALTCEEDRNMGWHHAIVPKRALTGPAYSEAAFSIIQDVSSLITRAEGIWTMRLVLPVEASTIANRKGDSPELWQTGPYGSDDYNFAAGIRNSQANPGHCEIYVTMARGAGFATYASFGGSFIIAPNQIPAHTEFDLLVAWKAGAIVALGIGSGAGSKSITWLTNGQIYNGFPVSIAALAGTAWDFPNAGTVASGARHIGLGADRDRTRQFGGWIQAIAAATAGSVVNATVQDSLAYHVAHRLGARGDYR